MPVNKSVEDLKEALNKPKQIDEILDEQIEASLHEHNRSNQDLFLSAISAGLEIGFTVFLMACIYSLFVDLVHPSFLHILLAIAYPLGFIFVIIGKSVLFTEHTTLAVIPVLDKSASIQSLLKLWAIVYAGNLLGGYFFGSVLSILPQHLHVIDNSSFYNLARRLIDHPWYIIVGSAVLAGWLMGLLSWLLASSQETISRIVLVVLITSVIEIGGLHHSIVGSIEVFTALVTSPEVGILDYLHVQTAATLGNIIGGVVFVALIKYSYVNPRKNRKIKNKDKS